MALSEATMQRLESRGFDVEFASRIGFDSETKRWPVSEEGGKTRWVELEALAIPFMRKGRLVRRKWKAWDRPDGAPAYQQDKGAIRIPWNEDALRDDTLLGQDLIITEGELDAAAAIQAGFLRSISVPDGAPMEPVKDAMDSAKYAWLQDPELKGLLDPSRCPVIIIAADGDEAGGALLHDLSHLLMRSRCKYVTYPLAPKEERERLGRDRCKDLNEVLQFYGEKGVQATIENAKWIQVDGVYKMSELPQLPANKVYRISDPRLERMNEHYKVRMGDFVVITAVPGVGKTTWANDFYCEQNLEHGLKIAWASFEQEPQRDHRRNLRSWYGKRDPLEECGRRGCRVKDMTPAEIADADAWIDENHVFIVPNEDDDVTLDWMLERMELAVIRHGVKIIVIDPWNEMDHARDRNESLTEYVGRAIKTLKRFAKKFQVHLVVIAHPTKTMKDKDGNYPMPSLYDISDSSHWYNKCVIGIVIHKFSKDQTTVKIQKSKYWDILGRPGEVVMEFNEETRRFVVTGKY